MGSDNSIGRNAPCPCGSRRKFKRCCSPKLGAARFKVRVHIGDARGFGELVAAGKRPEDIISEARGDALLGGKRDAQL